jgi:hypothetical protein
VQSYIFGITLLQNVQYVLMRPCNAVRRPHDKRAGTTQGTTAMQISSGMREGLAIGIGAALGTATAGGAYVALTSDDPGTKQIAGVVAGSALLGAAGISALMLRHPNLRPDVAMGAIGFVGLPALLATGMIENRTELRSPDQT